MDKKGNFFKTNTYSTNILLIILVCIILAITFIFQNHINNVNELNKLIFEQGNGRYINTNDTFIGTALTIIGILVTFVIGYQILNAIELKKEIENQKNALFNDYKKFENSIIEKLKEYEILLYDINKLKDNLEQNKYISDMDILTSRAIIATNNKEYYYAFFDYLCALSNRLYIKEETQFYDNENSSIYSIDSKKDLRSKLLQTAINVLIECYKKKSNDGLKKIIGLIENNYFKINYPLILSDSCYTIIKNEYNKLELNEPINEEKINQARNAFKCYMSFDI